MTITAYSYIRFSTPEQLYGDSLRRQMESSIAYADEHGLTLDTTLNLRDLGISAFRGANVEKGRLGAFIKAIDDGLVARGSYLLVESLDRLSRAEVMDAMEVFLAIVNRGIVIVTLLDGRLYSRDSLRENSTELIISIVIMSRAYDESITKSKRRRKTWNQSKRVAAESGKKMTRKLPFWLSLPDQDGEFVVNPEGAAVVRRVFELARAGLGYWKIAQALNADGVLPPAARNYTKEPKYADEPRTWATSSVGHLLRNEAVIGNLVMTEARTDRDEAPVPSRLDGYYPRVIDDELFYAVLGKRQAPRGRASQFKTNLFTGLLFCGYCHGPMQVDANTKNNRRRSTICCQRKRRAKACDCKNWNYEEFEEDFFAFVSEVDLAAVLEPSLDSSMLADEIAVLEGRWVSVKKLIDQLMENFENTKMPPSALARLNNREDEQEKIEHQLRSKRALLAAERGYLARAEAEISAIRNQVTTLRGLPVEERVVVRYSIAERIAAVVRSVHLYPNGSDLVLVDPATDQARPADPEPYFRVEFKNGITGLITPRHERSARFDLSKKPA